MTVDIKINGQIIDVVTIINHGPTSDAERNDPEGECFYEWQSLRHPFKGRTRHRRDEGAHWLAVDVIGELAVQISHANQGAHNVKGEEL